MRTIRQMLVPILAVTAGVCAQPLDLGRPPLPPPEALPARTVLVDQLTAEFNAEVERLAPPSAAGEDDDAPPAPDPASLPPTTNLELRRLALALAERGQLDAAGGRDLLTARTILQHLPAFEPVSDPDVAEALRDLVNAAPHGDDLDRALRDALAPLLRDPIPLDRGWVLAGSPTTPIRDIDPRAPAHAAASHEAARALTDAAVPTHLAGPARALRLRADAALDLYRPVPDWFGDDLAARLAVELLACIADTTLADPTAPARLDRLASIAAAVRAIDAVPRSRRVNEARAAAVRLVRTAAEATTDGAPLGDDRVHAQLEGAARLAALLSRGEPAADRDDLIRVLRPVWPRMLDRRRHSRERLTDFLPRAFEMSRPQAEPAFLALLTDAERADLDLDRLAHLSFVLCDGVLPEPPRRPEPAARFDDVADRLLQHIRTLPRRRDGLSPLRPHAEEVEFRRFLVDVERLIPSPFGEAPERRMLANLSGPSARRSAWLRLVGNRPNEFVDALRSRRESWLTLWRPDGSPDRHLAMLADEHARWLAAAYRWLDEARFAVELSEARAALRRGERPRSDAWPGWAIDESLCDALLRPYEADLRRAASALDRDDLAEANRALRTLERSHRLARLAGRLEAELPPIAVNDSGPRDALQRALWELAAGPCDTGLARFGAACDEIAEASAWAFELAAVSAPLRREIEPAANDAATRALRRLGAR